MSGPRISREKKTLSAMVSIYCRGNHHVHGLCKDCRTVLEYSLRKLDSCKFSESKPTCRKCPIHCYEPSMRETMRLVMRYSGPRMLLKHPILAIMHSVDGLAKPPKPANSRIL